MVDSIGDRYSHFAIQKAEFSQDVRRSNGLVTNILNHFSFLLPAPTSSQRCIIFAGAFFKSLFRPPEHANRAMPLIRLASNVFEFAFGSTCIERDSNYVL